jgi:hypothetical protein
MNTRNTRNTRNAHDIDRPFEVTMTECLSLIERIDELLGATEPLSPDEIRTRTRVPKFSSEVVPQIADICTELALSEVGLARVAEMARSFDQAATLRRMIERLELALGRLNASRMTSETSGWKAALAFYSVLQRMARDDESLRLRIEPVVSYFRKPRGRRPGLVRARALRPHAQ